MLKNRKENTEQDQQQVIAAQNQTGQFDKTDTEFSLEESVQGAVAKSQAFQAENQQPTYEPNKPI
ncbi:hypothetical protein KHA94_07100 [Bacillus sp. FJAT-49705]|uniref:Small, acid-soluble spore protein gamma-type n=1 Tax=Cytobacillus citreus TaxID=2833586 RepID=A0ABS5NQ69_9BACI|nr:hypothetical protein [Cytobacillus citreus]MBS4189972.1 hypothetical protein [Cytobacillus citreus]